MKRDYVQCPHCGKYDEATEERILDEVLVEEDWQNATCSNCGQEYTVLPECNWTFDTRVKPG